AFLDTAAEYLNCAKQISTPVTQGVNLEINTVEKLCERRRLASQFGIEQISTSRPVLDSPTDVEVEIEIVPHPKGSDFPPVMATTGRAAQQQHFGRLSPGDSHWGSLSLPPAEGSRTVQSARAHEIDGSSLDSVVFFRGRQYRQALDVNSLG